MTDLLYGLAMLGVFALAGGGLWMWNRDRTRSLLLLLIAAITLFNIWSWSSLAVGGEGPASGPDGLAAGGSG